VRVSVGIIRHLLAYLVLGFMKSEN